MKSSFLKMLFIVHIAPPLSKTQSFFDIIPHKPIMFMPNFLDTLDLTEYFDAFSYQPALITIDNFFNVDLKAPKYPVLLRKYIKGTLRYQSKYWKFEKLVWMNPVMSYLNGTPDAYGYMPT